MQPACLCTRSHLPSKGHFTFRQSVTEYAHLTGGLKFRPRKCLTVKRPQASNTRLILSPASLLAAEDPPTPNSCTGAPLVLNTLESDGKLEMPEPKAGVEPKEPEAPAVLVPKLKANGEGAEPPGDRSSCFKFGIGICQCHHRNCAAGG